MNRLLDRNPLQFDHLSVSVSPTCESFIQGSHKRAPNDPEIPFGFHVRLEGGPGGRLT